MTPTYPGHPVGIRPAVTIDSITPEGATASTEVRVRNDGSIGVGDPGDDTEAVLSPEGALALVEALMGGPLVPMAGGLLDHARATRQRWEESRIKDSPMVDGPGTDG